jgi:DNA-binding response OmpR family regulator
MATDPPGILIVDDNEDNRYTLQLMLESDGHERITCAAGGNEAIALIEKEKFSLVLLDLMMPDLNGDEVLKAIKSDPDQRDIPVVMISADTDADKVSQCIELGADNYLPKPFNPTILRARIGAALRRHSLRALESEYLGKLENEKRHCENLLRNILPAEIATRLRNGESNIADHFDDATVIFADVVGFGKITARMKAYEIVACLNQLFSEFDRLAEDAGIEAAFSASLKRGLEMGWLGFFNTANRPRSGLISLSSSTRFPASWKPTDDVSPVRFAPGRLMLVASPSATGSATSVKTIGMLAVAALTAFAAGGPSTAITSMFRRTRSAASSGTRS